MTQDKLKRVIWRLQEMKTDEPKCYTHKQIRLAIMEELGTDERTIKTNIDKLRELKMLVPAGMGKLKINIPVL